MMSMKSANTQVPCGMLPSLKPQSHSSVFQQSCTPLSLLAMTCVLQVVSYSAPHELAGTCCQRVHSLTLSSGM